MKVYIFVFQKVYNYIECEGNMGKANQKSLAKIAEDEAKESTPTVFKGEKLSTIERVKSSKEIILPEARELETDEESGEKVRKYDLGLTSVGSDAVVKVENLIKRMEEQGYRMAHAVVTISQRLFLNDRTALLKARKPDHQVFDTGHGKMGYPVEVSAMGMKDPQHLSDVVKVAIGIHALSKGITLQRMNGVETTEAKEFYADFGITGRTIAKGSKAEKIAGDYKQSAVMEAPKKSKPAKKWFLACGCGEVIHTSKSEAIGASATCRREDGCGRVMLPFESEEEYYKYNFSPPANESENLDRTEHPEDDSVPQSVAA